MYMYHCTLSHEISSHWQGISLYWHEILLYWREISLVYQTLQTSWLHTLTTWSDFCVVVSSVSFSGLSGVTTCTDRSDPAVLSSSCVWGDFLGPWWGPTCLLRTAPRGGGTWWKWLGLWSPSGLRTCLIGVEIIWLKSGGSWFSSENLSPSTVMMKGSSAVPVPPSLLCGGL